ncbi:MAG TPA: hypothetical protein VE978_22820 [Chitinophagales bacterium]|nr:hypothetical protein [Chitinophagales bacterium]
MAEIILGISPGTRIIGIAVLRNGELIDYGVKCFKERWTQTKKRSLLSNVDKLMEYYGVTVVAIKSCDPTRSSQQLELLSKEIVKVCESKKITVYSYGNATLKLSLGIKSRNKNALMAEIAELYPELRKMYLKEINNRHSYYEKMFEAIALIKWCQLENEL